MVSIPPHFFPTDPVAIVKGSQSSLDSLSLVLSSVGIDHHIDEGSGQILVDKHDETRAIDHIAKYREENRNWPPVSESVWLPPFYNPKVTILTMTAFILFYGVTGDWHGHNGWFTAGAVNRQAIIEGGEWWRLVTALTLHADMVHLIGNCIIGGHLILLLDHGDL